MMAREIQAALTIRHLVVTHPLRMGLVLGVVDVMLHLSSVNLASGGDLLLMGIHAQSIFEQFFRKLSRGFFLSLSTGNLPVGKC
jgi:hypothetical protein